MKPPQKAAMTARGRRKGVKEGDRERGRGSGAAGAGRARVAHGAFLVLCSSSCEALLS